MNRPKMILFDYGGTLVYEPDLQPERGNAALYPYITKNPHNVSCEEFSAYVKELFDGIRTLRGEYIELHEHIFLRYVLEHFDMELSVSIEEAERIICDGMSRGIMTPDADKMLAALRERGIRTGIISNLCWSGGALADRMERFFPEHDFEFIMTSSEYIFRKPDPHIFDLAIRKTGLRPDEIWFCGNDVEVDVMGSHNAGMFPVWYDDRSIPSRFYDKNDSFTIDFPHLRLNSWTELAERLDFCQET